MAVCWWEKKEHTCRRVAARAQKEAPLGVNQAALDGYSATARLDISTMNIATLRAHVHPQNADTEQFLPGGTAHRDQPSPPVGFQPSLYPIISRHFLSIKPLSFGAACATVVADPHYRRRIEHLHEQGARSVGELLAEIAIVHGLEADISERLARFAAISDDALDVTDGRCFPPDPIYEVSR